MASSAHGTLGETIALVSFEQSCDVFCDFDSLEVTTVPLVGGAVGGNEELLKVPGDVVAPHGAPQDAGGVVHEHRRTLLVGGRGQTALQHLEQGVGVLAVDLDLLEHVSQRLEPVARSYVPQAGHHLLRVGVLLVAELVGGEAGHTEVALELLQKLVHLQEVPGGRAS